MNIKMSEQTELVANQLLPLPLYKTIEEISVYKYVKRTIDVLVSIIGLTILSPLFLILCLAIRLDSKGKAIYSQMRIGKDGKLFKLYKFRTMIPNAEQKLEEYLSKNETARNEYKINRKLRNDPRITKIGTFLRKTSLDELPQLINVLKGEMTLIGPRPYLPSEKDDMLGYYYCIIQSKPGITGLWQVSGRSNTTFQERLDMDLEYNERKSLKQDIEILFKTITVILKKEGAV